MLTLKKYIYNTCKHTHVIYGVFLLGSSSLLGSSAVLDVKEN